MTHTAEEGVEHVSPATQVTASREADDIVVPLHPHMAGSIVTISVHSRQVTINVCAVVLVALAAADPVLLDISARVEDTRIAALKTSDENCIALFLN
jgi:hypothetical protein